MRSPIAGSNTKESGAVERSDRKPVPQPAREYGGTPGELGRSAASFSRAIAGKAQPAPRQPPIGTGPQRFSEEIAESPGSFLAPRMLTGAWAAMKFAGMTMTLAFDAATTLTHDALKYGLTKAGTGIELAAPFQFNSPQGNPHLYMPGNFKAIDRLIADGLGVERTNEAERRFWLSFYDDPLPRALLNNYMDGKGKVFMLTEAQMQAVNGTLNFRRSAAFESTRAELGAEAKKAQRSKSAAVSGRFLSSALNNGTLGGFTVNYEGRLSVTPKGDWTYQGTIDYYDRWDFDPRPLGAKSGRSAIGELKTRVGAYIEGEPFDVRSVKAKVIATETGVEWGGKAYKPAAVIDPLTSDRIPRDWKAAPGIAVHTVGETAQAAASDVKRKLAPPVQARRTERRDGSLTGPWYPEFGSAQRYLSPEHALSDGSKVGIFINGPDKGFEDHAREAQELANRLTKPVVGIWDAGGLTRHAAAMRPAVQTLRNILRRHGNAEDKGSGLDIYSPNEFLVEVGRTEARKERDPKADLKPGLAALGNAAEAAQPLAAEDRGAALEPELPEGTTPGIQPQNAPHVTEPDKEEEFEEEPAHAVGPLRGRTSAAESADSSVARLGPLGPDSRSDEKPPAPVPSPEKDMPASWAESRTHPEYPVAATVAADMPVIPKATFGVEARSYDPRLNATPVPRALRDFSPRSEAKRTVIVQRKGVAGRTDDDPGSLREDLIRKGDGGFAPPSTVRKELMPHLGFDPSEAKIHIGPHAAQAASRMGAEAFTVGRDVFFGAGKYDPASRQGLALIAHELTHVGQQTGTTGDKTRFYTHQGGDEMEAEAQQTAERFLTNLATPSGLIVESYACAYQNENEHPLTAHDQHRLDRISTLALEKAGRRVRQVASNKVIEEISIDVAIDLGNMSDSEAASIWADAIVEQVKGRVGITAPEPPVKLMVQRYDTDEHVMFGGPIGKQQTITIKGVKMEYGDVIAMGDFFANPDEILTKADPKTLQAVVDLIHKKVKDPNSVGDADWERVTGGAYVDLALKNDAHFAPSDPSLMPADPTKTEDHKALYAKYHEQALKLAQQHKRDEALAVNAFADHFLTDAFAAGHLFRKKDAMALFRKNLGGKKGVEKLTEEVAKLAWADPGVSSLMSQYETVETHYGFHPDIDRESRFASFLQGVDEAMPEAIENAIAGVMHDHLNTVGVDVENGQGAKWKLSGDEHLNVESLKYARQAVARSQQDILDALKDKPPKDATANVWKLTPHPTASGMKTMKQDVARFLDPTMQTSIVAIADYVKSHIHVMLNKAVAMKKLQRADGKTHVPTPDPVHHSRKSVLGLEPPDPGEEALKKGLADGITDVRKLTDRVFLARHPERKGQTKVAKDKAQIAEWIEIRDKMVKPALPKKKPARSALPGLTPDAGSQEEAARRVGAKVAGRRTGEPSEIIRSPLAIQKSPEDDKVAKMTKAERVMEAGLRAMARMDETLKDLMRQIFTWQNVEWLIGISAVLAAANFTPYGWAADLAVAGYFIFQAGYGTAVALKDFCVGIVHAANATTELGLNNAADEIRDAAGRAGVNGLQLFLSFRMGKGALAKKTRIEAQAKVPPPPVVKPPPEPMGPPVPKNLPQEPVGPKLPEEPQGPKPKPKPKKMQKAQRDLPATTRKALKNAYKKASHTPGWIQKVGVVGEEGANTAARSRGEYVIDLNKYTKGKNFPTIDPVTSKTARSVKVKAIDRVFGKSALRSYLADFRKLIDPSKLRKAAEGIDAHRAEIQADGAWPKSWPKNASVDDIAKLLARDSELTIPDDHVAEVRAKLEERIRAHPSNYGLNEHSPHFEADVRAMVHRVTPIGLKTAQMNLIIENLMKHELTPSKPKLPAGKAH
ncbi:MAG TPA: DUF4157 domain-containing protein [Fimbriimonadaceae bacterium]|nr:DUF4157 domain-containing protein [Fimbriimonadaceae bacterium]